MDDNYESAINFKKEREAFLEWCKTNEPCSEDYFALFMLSYRDGEFGGLG